MYRVLLFIFSLCVISSPFSVLTCWLNQPLCVYSLLCSLMSLSVRLVVFPSAWCRASLCLHRYVPGFCSQPFVSRRSRHYWFALYFCVATIYLLEFLHFLAFRFQLDITALIFLPLPERPAFESSLILQHLTTTPTSRHS